MHENVAFGRWLKQRRRSLDLTQDELAARVGCAPGTVRKLEAGGRRPSKAVAQGLADSLQLVGAERVEFLQLARAAPVDVPPPDEVLPPPDGPSPGTGTAQAEHRGTP